MKELKNYIRFDWAAKRILRDKANFSVLEGFVSVLLNQEVKIVEILESEGNMDQQDSKFNRVDIMAKNDRGELIMIEIQLSRQVHYLERILFGVGKAINDHIAKGDNYRKVKKVYSISILYFDFGTGKDFVYRGQTLFKGLHTGDEFMLSERERIGLGMRTPREVFPEYYLIRVNEFNKMASTPLEEWLEYLKSGKINPETTTPGLREAAETLEFLSMNETERKTYERYLDNLRNEQESLESAKLEGRAEGIAEGRAEGIAEGRAEEKLEIARNLIGMGYAPESVAKATGLDLDVILSI